MKKSTIAAVASLALTGCASNYFHPALMDPLEIKRQQQIDKAECDAWASGAAPFPSYVPVPSGSSSYNVSLTQSYFDRNTYTGTATPTGGGFSKGFASGQNLGASIAAGMEKRKLSHACMLKRGWTETEAEAQSVREKMSNGPGQQ